MARLEALGASTGGVAALDPERTLADARESDERLRAGASATRPLEGVPITVKDWIDVAGWPIVGEGTDRDRRPAHDASAVARLRAAGAVVAGITSALAESRAHGVTRNPRDPARAPGGSSSGAAAAVAAGASVLALGSDSGGSIRLPAAWCGVAGLRPSFGRVPLTGHFPRLAELSDARTAIGPLANTVDDLAGTLELIAGPDGIDPGALPVPLGDPASIDVARLRVATVPGGVPSHVEDAVTALADAGAQIARDAVPDGRDESLDITRRYWNRLTLDGVAQVALLWDWDRFRRRLLVAMADVDAVVLPATTEPAPPWRESIETDYVWQLPWSLTGSPAVVVPFGVDATNGLPLSVQIVAKRWDDHIALAVARVIEQRAR
jgi:amidase